jgi:hypothetical protein
VLISCRVVDIPSFRSYALRLGQRLEVEVVQPDGGRALVACVLEAVPDEAVKPDLV